MATIKINRIKFRNFCGITFLNFIVILVCSNIVNGQSYIPSEGDTINPRVYISTGFYFPNVTTSLRIDSKQGIGTEINLEDDIKFDENLSVFRLNALLKVSKKSQFLFGYTAMKRERSFVLEEDVEFSDTTFYIGAYANLYFDIDYYSFTWRYSLYNERSWNAGFSLGLRGISIKTGLEASLNSSSYSKDVSAIAPAILGGVHLGGYLRPKLLARYSLEYLYFEIDGIDIIVLETNASVQYFFFKNVGLGAAYSTNNYKINEIPLNDNFTGKVLFAFDGFNVFLTARIGNKSSKKAIK